jgi:hypothetical protein
MLLNPCGPIGIRSRAGTLARLTLQSGGKRRSCLSAANRPTPFQDAPSLARFTFHNGGEVLVLIRSAGAPSRFQNGADVPAGYPSMATTIGLEPTSSTFGRSRSSS